MFGHVDSSCRKQKREETEEDLGLKLVSTGPNPTAIPASGPLSICRFGALVGCCVSSQRRDDGERDGDLKAQGRGSFVTTSSHLG